MAETSIDSVDYDPLGALIGIWKGDKGVDRGPEPDGVEREFTVSAEAGLPKCGILRAPLMFKQVKTTAFKHTLKVCGDDMSDPGSTILDMYDKTDSDHNDVNTRVRVA